MLNRKIRKKVYTLSLVAVLSVIGLSGCAANITDTLFTDSGTDVIQNIDTSQYLDLERLNHVGEEEETWNGYEVYTLETGTFETPVNGIKANIMMVEINPVKAEFDYGTMHLLEICVSRNTYVKKGDVIAKVSMETNTLDLEELHRKHLRLEEEYAEYLEDYEERHEEAVTNRSLYEKLRELEAIEIRQMELDHEYRMADYEERIANSWEEILQFRQSEGITQIVAPQSGYVLDVSWLKAGDILYDGTMLCQMAPSDKLMVEFEDETWHYGYGMDLTLYAGDRRIATGYEVEAVSAIGKVLYEDWGQTTTKVAGDYNMADLMKSRPYTITGSTNVMQNVVLVPVDAVTKDGERYFVTVLHEDGTLEKKQFIAGGENANYFWVFDGLTAGTKIVIKD